MHDAKHLLHLKSLSCPKRVPALGGYVCFPVSSFSRVLSALRETDFHLAVTCNKNTRRWNLTGATCSLSKTCSKAPIVLHFALISSGARSTKDKNPLSTFTVKSLLCRSRPVLHQPNARIMSRQFGLFHEHFHG